MGKRKDTKPRFRRTKAEIAAGLTFEEAIEARKNALKNRQEKRWAREQKRIEKEKRIIERRRIKKNKSKQKRILCLELRIKKREEAIQKLKAEIDKLKGNNPRQQENDENLTRWELLDCEDEPVSEELKNLVSDNTFRTKVTVVIAKVDGKIHVLATKGDLASPGKLVAQLIYKDIYRPDQSRVSRICIVLRSLTKSIFYPS